MPELDLELTSK